LKEVIENKEQELKNTDKFKLADDKVASLQKAIQQTTKSKISPLSLPDFDISQVIDEVSPVLQTTVVSQIIEALKSDEVVSKWVEHGLSIHKDRELKNCAFCNQIIPQNRFSELEQHFNEDYQRLIEKLDSLKQKLENRKVTISFPDASSFYDDLAEEYLSIKKEAEQTITAFNQKLDFIISAVTKKEQKPFSKVDLEKIESAP
jgi:hypothetical protein